MFQEILNIFKDIFVPLVALTTSIIALYYSTKGLKMQREHNYKSLKPIGKLRSLDYDEDIILRIDNYGTGPLIIESIYANNQKIDKDEGLVNLLPNGIKEELIWTSFTAKYEGRAIPPNDNLILLH